MLFPLPVLYGERVASEASRVRGKARCEDQIGLVSEWNGAYAVSRLTRKESFGSHYATVGSTVSNSYDRKR
jgi:hypothetical protein